MDAELVALSTQLADAAIRNTATAVADRITAAKARRRDQDTIAELEDIVSNLQSDKNELVRIAQAYEQELVGQRISPEDVEYLTTNVVPIVRDLHVLTSSNPSPDQNDESGDDVEDHATDDHSALDILVRLLSVETINILQLVGFNFREAIGGPLTDLVSRLISAQGPLRVENLTRLQELQVERDLETLRLAQDSASVNRYRRITGSS